MREKLHDIHQFLLDLEPCFECLLFLLGDVRKSEVEGKENWSVTRLEFVTARKAVLTVLGIKDSFASFLW